MLVMFIIFLVSLLSILSLSPCMSLESPLSLPSCSFNVGTSSYNSSHLRKELWSLLKFCHFVHCTSKNCEVLCPICELLAKLLDLVKVMSKSWNPSDLLNVFSSSHGWLNPPLYWEACNSLWRPVSCQVSVRWWWMVVEGAELRCCLSCPAVPALKYKTPIIL